MILSAGHQALAARSGIQLRLVPSPRGVFVGVGVCGSMSVQQVSGVPWGWHRGAKMRFELEWGGSWDRASAERSAIAACQRRTRRGRDGRGRSRLRCHRHLFADFFFFFFFFFFQEHKATRASPSVPWTATHLPVWREILLQARIPSHRDYPLYHHPLQKSHLNLYHPCPSPGKPLMLKAVQILGFHL